ncbi:MAG: hypothetical protein OCC49_10380 [Fibrobacterales bacterium]
MTHYPNSHFQEFNSHENKFVGQAPLSAKRYLTKSRFKLACECPTKLFYTKKPEYADSKQDDTFLQALAEGGHQVGELAKLYYPGGHDITTLDYTEALNQTNELLKQENVIIYEAAIAYKTLFIRADVLVKKGNTVDLIEVKAKSIDPTDSQGFMKKRGGIESKWKPYLYDIAFQKYVTENAFPHWRVKPHLMLANKTVPCPTEGLYQKFKLIKDKYGRAECVGPASLTSEELEHKILTTIDVSHECDLIYTSNDGFGMYTLQGREYTFAERIALYADHYNRDDKITPCITSHCGKCEYKASPESSLKSGVKECFSQALGWKEPDFAEPTIFDIWNFRGKDALIAEGKVKMRQLSESDINPQSANGHGITPKERQWLQIEKTTKGESTPWIDKDGLKTEMATWAFPLHFIDFETGHS